MYYPFVRRALFQLDPERAHGLTFQQLRRITDTPLGALIRQKVPAKPVTCMGLTFKNPLGLAAGLDKDGECIDALGAVGFGSVEIGTVTLYPQSGNDKSRPFRLVDAEGLINHIGFNNHRVDNLVENAKKLHFDGILGINVSENKDIPVEDGKDGYLIYMEKVHAYAGYIATNISSPSMPGLCTLQYGETLDDLLATIRNKQDDLQAIHHKYVPMAVKITPGFSVGKLIQAADSLARHNIDGIIAINTVLGRSLVQGMKNCNQMGGLSGRLLQLKSTEIIHQLSQELKGQLPIIDVGGIDSAVVVRERIATGATLVQIYSGFIFKGPPLIKGIVSNI